MIKTLLMVECDQCDSVFSEIITVTNSSELPRGRIHSLLLNVEEAGWQSLRASTTHICYDCWHPEKTETKVEESFCPF
jgi:hypothetical protein